MRYPNHTLRVYVALMLTQVCIMSSSFLNLEAVLHMLIIITLPPGVKDKKDPFWR